MKRTLVLVVVLLMVLSLTDGYHYYRNVYKQRIMDAMNADSRSADARDFDEDDVLTPQKRYGCDRHDCEDGETCRLNRWGDAYCVVETRGMDKVKALVRSLELTSHDTRELREWLEVKELEKMLIEED
ncbi:uncharacterized protein LOC144449523 [Glandiceps talaboti]